MSLVKHETTLCSAGYSFVQPVKTFKCEHSCGLKYGYRTCLKRLLVNVETGNANSILRGWVFILADLVYVFVYVEFNVIFLHKCICSCFNL